MKKPTSNVLQHRKLVIRCESIAVLTPRQLSRAAGGNGTWPPYINTDETYPLYG